MSQSRTASNPATSRSAAASGALLDIRRIRVVLGRSPHFNALPSELLDRLARLGRIERHKGGELIHAAWQPVDKLWVVLSGALRVALLSEDGGALTIAALGEGSYYRAGPIDKGEVVRTEAHAIGSTHLAVFEFTRLEQEFSGNKLMEDFEKVALYRRLEAAVDAYRDLVIVPLPQRVARRLLGQALAAGRGPEIELRVSQADLAAMLHASRSKVNAELRRLEQTGAVRLGYGKIFVCDLRLLRAAAGATVLPL